MHRTRALPYSSSPVVHGALLYTVTSQPTYVHRIALSTGKRQVCRLQLNGTMVPELPGVLPDYAPPLLFRLPERAASRAGLDSVLVILTTEGLCILEIDSLARSPEPVLKGRFLPEADYRRHAWTRPAAVGPFIVATSHASPAALCLDMTDYPNDVRSQVVQLKKLRASVGWNSPCIGLRNSGRNAERSACWYTTDDDNKESRLILFRPPTFYDVVEIAWVGVQNRYVEDNLGPVTDGKKVYLPYYSKTANTMGLISYDESGPAVQHIDIPTPGVSSFLAAVADHTLVYPGRSRLYKVDPKHYAPKPDSCGTLASNGRETTCLSRPIVAGSRVFVQCSGLVSCFELRK